MIFVSIGNIIGYLILIPFFIMNLILSLNRFLKTRFGKFIVKIGNSEEDFSSKYEIIYKAIFIIMWIVVGTYSVLNLDEFFKVGTIIVFFSFRSGAKIGQRVIFGIHDIQIMKNNESKRRINKIITRAIRFSLIVEILFLISWALFYRTMKDLVKTNFGLEVNFLVLILWLMGLTFGVILGAIQSIFSKNFLLKNEIGLMLFFK